MTLHTLAKKLAAAVSALAIISFTAHAQSGSGAVPATAKQGAKPRAVQTERVKPESWDRLRVERGDLHADEPLLGENAAYPGFTREFLRVQWRTGDPIELFVLRPTGRKNPPVILYLYGYPTDSDRFRNLELDKNLTKNGFAAVGFASALTGQRFHNRPLKKWFVSELQESMATTVHDVQMVLNYLEDRGDMDMSRVGIFGEGSGGAIAILSAAVDSRIKAVDVMNPWGDWPEWLAKSSHVPDDERPKYLTSDFLSRINPLDPIVWLPKLAGRPVRVQEVLFDTSYPETVRTKLQSAAPADTTVVAYKTQQDYISNVSTNARMLDWIHTQLEPASPVRNPAVAEDTLGSKEDTKHGEPSIKAIRQ